MIRLLCLAAAFCVTACTIDKEAEENPNAAKLELTYVSGHLGSYWDCPEEATSFEPEARAASPADEDAGAIAGDCADENCGGFLNCEAAMVRLRLSNTGAEAFGELNVTGVRLIHEGDVFELEVTDVRLADGEAWLGALEAGAQNELHIEFRGPGPRAFDYDDLVQIQIDVEEDDNGASITTPELQAVPAVAT